MQQIPVLKFDTGAVVKTSVVEPTFWNICAPGDKLLPMNIKLCHRHYKKKCASVNAGINSISA